MHLPLKSIEKMKLNIYLDSRCESLIWQNKRKLIAISGGLYCGARLSDINVIQVYKIIYFSRE